jgi:hypothetical protein
VGNVEAILSKRVGTNFHDLEIYIHGFKKEGTVSSFLYREILNDKKR